MLLVMFEREQGLRLFYGKGVMKLDNILRPSYIVSSLRFKVMSHGEQWPRCGL